VRAWRVELPCPALDVACDYVPTEFALGEAQADPPEVAVVGDTFTATIADVGSRTECWAYVLRFDTGETLEATQDVLVYLGPDGTLTTHARPAPCDSEHTDPIYGALTEPPPCPDDCGYEGGVGVGEFTTPADDDAPWYDADVPESADVLGVWVEEARLSVPWTREARPRQRGGSLSPARYGPRELTISGWVYTRSEAATAYARHWLFEALSGGDCGDGCSLPDALVWTHCDVATPDAGKRTLRRVGLTSYDPEIEPEFPRRCGFKFEAVLAAEVPDLLLDPVLLADVELDGDVECNLCHPCPEVESGCSCGSLSSALRVAPQPDPSSSFCEPVAIMRSCVELDPPPLWRDATAIITVSAGEWAGDPSRPGVANLRVRGWANPAGLTDPDLFVCQEPCLDVEVACVPAGAQLVIDGTTRSAVVLCEQTTANGYAYLSSAGGRRFQWPDVTCQGLWLCVDADALNTADGSTLAVEYVQRERG
jgi:hypothetical protein